MVTVTISTTWYSVHEVNRVTTPASKFLLLVIKLSRFRNLKLKYFSKPFAAASLSGPFMANTGFALRDRQVNLSGVIRHFNSIACFFAYDPAN
jgi:hypothetical protein